MIQAYLYDHIIFKRNVIASVSKHNTLRCFENMKLLYLIVIRDLTAPFKHNIGICLGIGYQQHIRKLYRLTTMKIRIPFTIEWTFGPTQTYFIYKIKLNTKNP